MFSCLTALAALVAVVALAIAWQARTEVRELRRRLEGGETLAPPAGGPSGVHPAPVSTSAAEALIPIYQPPPAEPAAAMAAAIDEMPETPPPAADQPPLSSPASAGIDWENLVGIRLFSWIAGIALVLSAVFLFKYSVEHGWLRPAVRAALGLAGGIAILVISETKIARAYRFTANAMDGAGIAILYATLFALYARWELWPAAASFGGMLLVTAAAVVLSTRRDSLFIALLGLIGGFATPALLSSGENRPIALFSYLLLLNAGISWIAWQKRWPLLTALSVVLTVVYQWAWVERFLTAGQLPLAAAIFVVFGFVAASSLWPEPGEGRPSFRRIAAAGAVLPLLFAFFTAIVPEYGSHYHVLFSFLLLMVGGLGAIASWRGPVHLHTLGAAATLITFFIWVVVSYGPTAWPGVLVWLAVFVALYLAADLKVRTVATHAAPLLFFVFLALAVHEPARYLTLSGAMFALLTIVTVFAFQRSRPELAVPAIGFGAITVMALDRMPATWMTTSHAILLAVLLGIAYSTRKPWLAFVATPFYGAALLAAIDRTPAERVSLAAVLLVLFVGYAFLARRSADRRIVYLTISAANIVFFIPVYLARQPLGYEPFIGLLPLTQAVLLGSLLYAELRGEGRAALEDPRAYGEVALLTGVTLAFFTAAIPVQLEKEWITIAFAAEAAALAWAFLRIPHRGLLIWSGGLAAAVLVRLVLNPSVFEYHPKTATPFFNWYLYAYLASAAAMFAIVAMTRRTAPLLARFAATAGAIELFVLLNIEIADYYSTGRTLTFNFISSSLAQDLTYTMGWALFAMGMLIVGITFQSRSTRIAALGLLFVTILKCFLHDLARLGGLYRVASLFGLAVALVAVGLLLQKFVMLKRENHDPARP